VIAGIDEVGRGAWAGPLCVGVVVLGEAEISGLTDSKALSCKKRNILAREICEKSHGVGLGWVSSKQIDAIGLSAALKLASQRALLQIDSPDIDSIIIDGTVKFIDDPRVTTLKKADLLVPSVSAASIVAKVARDNYMAKLDNYFENYDFSSHVGYGTAKHSEMLEQFGPSPVHRLSFAPVRKLLSLDILDKNSSGINKGFKSAGNMAEDEASKYLEKSGYKIIDRNWKTYRCEIDIIAEKNEITYFVEVKYRSSNREGTGLEYITKKKLDQMNFAARIWRLKTKHVGSCQLAGLELTGKPPRIVDDTQLIKLL
jgi:ribonuclease HII